MTMNVRWCQHDFAILELILRLFELSRVLVRFDHVASIIRVAAKLCVVNCVADCVPQATQWQRSGN